MSDSDLSFAVFIDYDNLLPLQKKAGIVDAVTRALVQLPIPSTVARGKCEIRIYGGWYEGTLITSLAQTVSVEIQRDFPRILRLPTVSGGQLAFTLNAALAVSMIQEPGHHLFNTFRRKGKPSNIRVVEPAAIGCTDTGCVLPLVKKLLKSGNCPKAGCTVAGGNLVYRNEQKVVDTMLTCDLIHAGQNAYNRIILISGDDDFLPPLRSIGLRGAAAVRFHPKPNCPRAAFPQGGSVLLELDL